VNNVQQQRQQKHLVLISLTNPSFLILGEVHSELPSIDLITLQIAPCTQSCLLIPKLTETIAFWLASFPVQYQSGPKKKEKLQIMSFSYPSASMKK
jgi:hypothetical protein